jgi:ATP-binding cassette subfamily C protein EexD
MPHPNTLPFAELKEALADCRQHFIYAGTFSAAVNILMLTPIIYMMAVYDRVVASGSLSTLAMLTLLMVALLLASGGFEWVRAQILIVASNRMEANLRKRVSDATFKRALLTGGMVKDSQPRNDLNSLRQFLTGSGLFAFFDAPWFPIYLAIMFMFHVWFGIIGLVGGILMVILAIAQEKLTNTAMQEANTEANKVSAQFQSGLRNAEVVAGMGMADAIRRRQENSEQKVITLQISSSRKAAMLSAITKSARLIMQSLALGLGAYLALRQEISPGMMIAGSLLLGRALAPIDMLVGSWKGFSVARAQYQRLGELLDAIPKDEKRMSLPAPNGQIRIEQVTIVPPGSRIMAVKGVSFDLDAGETLGIVGPSASGKSSLARAILGIWPAYAGKVRLDGADISSWDRNELGPHVGYLPQDIELFDGTIADNICRFQDADESKIVEAAVLTGVHEMILRLPSGYDTIIGGSGGVLSGGQRQRVGLARAAYGSPKLILLDEPNSNLDDQGERELVEAIKRIKSLGTTVILITHRTMVLQCVDKILLMKEGVAASFGPKDQVLASLAAPTSAPKSAAR